MMQVWELRNKLLGADPFLEVVAPGSDHSYNAVRFAGVTPAERVGSDYYEYYDQAHMLEDGTKAEVFLID